MAALKSAFEAMDYKNVRTVLASGNVIFEASRKDRAMGRAIAQKLATALGFPVTVLIRTVRELKAIVRSEPFKDLPPGPDVQQYVTFLDGKDRAPGRAGLPATPRGVQIVKVERGEVYSVVRLSRGGRTPDLMNYLDRSFGPAGTTRNWRTVLRLSGGQE